MPARLSAFVIWALVAASAVFWGLRLFVKPPVAPVHTRLASDNGPVRVDLTRMLGAPPVQAPASVQTPAISSRFQLTGVMAPLQAGGDGIALIAVDGKMPRAYHVGAALDGELVLQSVNHRSVSIGPAQGAAAVVLELPVLPPPATGILPPASAMMQPGGAPVAMQVPPSPVVPMGRPMAQSPMDPVEANMPAAARRSRGAMTRQPQPAQTQ